jgi:hypothetical protein
MRLIWKLITSYPMMVIDPCYFRDAVSGKNVMLCQDRHGRYWMAGGRWDFLRVSC